LDKEVEKLFKKEIKLNFEKKRIYENPFERQLSDHEIGRKKFIENFENNKNKIFDFETKTNFKENIDNIIELTNNIKEQENEEKNKNEKMNKIFNENFFNYLSIICFLSFTGFGYYFYKLRQFYKTEKQKAIYLMNQEIELKREQEITSRFIFKNQQVENIQYDFRK
jgi:hypothetical protein